MKINKIFNILKKETNKDPLIKELIIRNYNKTPVFLFFLIFIFIINLFFFFFDYLFENETIEYHKLFISNHSFLVINYFHFQRIFLYPFAQNVRGIWNILFSFLFVTLTFKKIGFYFEVFLKSKKTLFILLSSIPLLGLFFAIFPISDDIFIFGSEWICLILIGGFLFILLMKKGSEQSLRLIKWTIIKTSFILICILIFRFSNFHNKDIELISSSIERKKNVYLLLPIFAICLGFFLTSIAHFKELKNTIILKISFFCIFLIIILLVVFMYKNLNTINSDSSENTKYIIEQLDKFFLNLKI